MATIDQYKHKLLGFINCPSDYDFVFNNPTRDIAVYELLEDIPDNEIDFDGKTGDIIVGGGSGEAPALRMSMPDCLNFFILDKDVEFGNHDELFKTFWTPTQSFKLCCGFKKIGWDVATPIEFWLTKNICKVLIKELEKFETLNTGQEFVTTLIWTSVDSSAQPNA